jgi:outer membrane protein TolC
MQNERLVRFPLPVQRPIFLRIRLCHPSDQGHRDHRPMVKTRGNRLIPLRRVLAGLLCISALPALAQDSAEQGPELPLAEAIQIALANNRPVQLAKFDVMKSLLQVAEVKTRRFPMFNTSLLASGDITSPAFTFQQGVFGNINGTPIPTQNVSIPLSHGVTGYAIVTVDQPVSQLYQIHLAIREEELSSDKTKQQYKGKQQSVVADVKQAYYAVLQTESAMDAQKALVKQYIETDRLATQYLGQKSVLKSDSLEAKAQLAQAQQQLITLGDNLQTQKEHLNDLLGRDIDTPFRTQPVPPATPEEMELKQARQTALAQRPEVQEAKIDVDRAEYDRRLAKSKYIPEIGAAVRYFTPINTQLLPENILTAGVAMNWDPFDWGRRRDEVKQKDITVQQSEVQLDQVRSQVLLDVDNTFRKLSESRSLLAVAQAGRDAANEKLREVNDQFAQSSVLLRDVLKQQAAVATANHDYEESLLSFWNAKALFEKALGEE